MENKVFILIYIVIFSYFKGLVVSAYDARQRCGDTEIDTTRSLCCEGLVYARSGRQPQCCGAIGYDAFYYFCCGDTTIQRKHNYKLPQCCGTRGYDGTIQRCVNGYLERKTEFGSTCCLTQGKWRCCEHQENCCPRAGLRSRQVALASNRDAYARGIDIPGFRPICCDESQTRIEKSKCCARSMETYGNLPSCCSDESVKPLCCRRGDNSLRCCPSVMGYCCGLTEYEYQERFRNLQEDNVEYRPRADYERSRPRIDSRPRPTQPPRYIPRQRLTQTPRYVESRYEVTSRPRTDCCYVQGGNLPLCCYAATISAQCCSDQRPRDNRQREENCCSVTRRTCCRTNVQIQMPPCCYSNVRVRPACCTMTHNVRSYSECCTSEDSDLEEDMPSCCDASLLRQCCRDNMIRYGKAPRCCAQLETGVRDNRGPTNSQDRRGSGYGQGRQDARGDEDGYVPGSQDRDNIYPDSGDSRYPYDGDRDGYVSGGRYPYDPDNNRQYPRYTFTPLPTVEPAPTERYSGYQPPVDPVIDSQSGEGDDVYSNRNIIREKEPPLYISGYDTAQLSNGETGVYEHDKHDHFYSQVGIQDPPMVVDESMYDMYEDMDKIRMKPEDLVIEYDSPMMVYKWDDDFFQRGADHDGDQLGNLNGGSQSPNREHGGSQSPNREHGGHQTQNRTHDRHHTPTRIYREIVSSTPSPVAYSRTPKIVYPYDSYYPGSRDGDQEQASMEEDIPIVDGYNPEAIGVKEGDEDRVEIKDHQHPLTGQVIEHGPVQTRFVDTPGEDSILFDPISQLVYQTYYEQTQDGWIEMTEIRKAEPQEIDILPLLPGYVRLKTDEENQQEKEEMSSRDSDEFYPPRPDDNNKDADYSLLYEDLDYDSAYAEDYFEYEESTCAGEPYDITLYICCDGKKSFRIGVQPECCGDQAFDAFMYECCEGEIRRSCDPDYQPQKTSWGSFI